MFMDGMLSDTELRKKHDKLLAQLVEVDEEDVQTKTDLIRMLIAVSRPLLQNDLIKGLTSNDLATYINAKLIENGITFQRNDKFYNLFGDSEKRKYGTNVNSPNGRIDHEHNFVGDYNEKKCECGDIIFYGKHFTLAPPPTEKVIAPQTVTQEKQDKSKKRPYSNPVVNYLQSLTYLIEDYADLLHDQVKKYYKYETVAKALDEFYKDKDMKKLLIIELEQELIRINNKVGKTGIGFLEDEVKHCQSLQIHADKNSDARQKVGEFEKIKAYILQLTTHTVAHVAKLINITPKHMTNNVIRNMEKSEKLLRWFKTVFVICPHCKKQVEWVAYDWFNAQCERKELDMNMAQPILHNNK